VAVPELSPEVAEGLLRYLAVRDRQRDEEVTRVLDAMDPREARLVREAAVHAFVLGTRHGAVSGPSAEIPADSAVLADVISGCLTMPDLYPVFALLAKSAGGR
jgi:hypothetical protein